MAEPERRRRRLRPSSSPASPAPEPATSDETAGTPAGAPMTEQPRPPRPAPSRRPTSGAGAGGGTDDREAERGLRGLVGSGSSQVSVGAAMRARDAARPTDEQLADADANLTIVRRNWQPKEELPKR